MTFLEMSLSGAVFILAIALFRAVFLRRLPKGTFVALWWLAAARLLLPVELASRFSVYTLLEALGPKASAPAAAPVLPAAPAGPPVLIVPAAPAAPAPKPFPVWTAVWVAVGLALAIWFLIRYARWRRRFRESLPLGGFPGLETWFSRPVEVRVSDRIDAPLTYGLLRPVILLPKNLDLKDEEALACVLAHERAHIRRLDGLLKLVLTAAVCLHWFNPAAWLLYVLGNRDMELRCDEAAVLALGEENRERYALALIRLAENRNVPLCGFAHRSGMEERIKAIMSIKRKSLLACFLALALVLGITTAFATSAKPPEADRPDQEDIIDGDLLAESSAETAALWDEVLAPYAPFGLTWTFDDPDLDGNGLTMTWEGYEVRGIYDQERTLWITEHAGISTYGPDAVELCTIYENGELAGLRLATEGEEKGFGRDRRISSNSGMTMALAESVLYKNGRIYFTIPKSEGRWSIFIQGRILMEDGSGMSVHYLEEESERAEWVPEKTYSFEVADAAYEDLTLEIRYGNACYIYPLTQLLPEGASPLAADPLPEGKADIPEGAEMIWPVDSTQITNSFGNRAKPGGEGVVTHTGVDIGGMEKGTPVYAAGKGTVKEAGYNARDGHFVRIDHGGGQETFYAHCASLLVNTGDEVRSGQTIATVGSTGQSTGPHLHFEFLVDGVAQNPETMLKSGQDAAKAVGTSKIEEYYEAGNLPMFQVAFSQLAEEARGEWLNKIYADQEIAFLGAAVTSEGEDSASVRRLAETAYEDGNAASFSLLAARMSGSVLEDWLARAREDENWAFQSILYKALGRDGEFDELEAEKEKEKEWAEAQRAEYAAAGVTMEGKNYYYQGQLVNVFLDVRSNQAFYTLEVNPAGSVNIKIVRDADNEITGVSYLTEAELEDLFG